MTPKKPSQPSPKLNAQLDYARKAIADILLNAHNDSGELAITGISLAAANGQRAFEAIRRLAKDGEAQLSP